LNSSRIVSYNSLDIRKLEMRPMNNKMFDIAKIRLGVTLCSDLLEKGHLTSRIKYVKSFYEISKEYSRIQAEAEKPNEATPDRQSHR